MGSYISKNREYICGPKQELSDYYNEIKKDVKIRKFDRERNIYTKMNKKFRLKYKLFNNFIFKNILKYF
jgi:hypothetical protein